MIVSVFYCEVLTLSGRVDQHDVRESGRLGTRRGCIGVIAEFDPEVQNTTILAGESHRSANARNGGRDGLRLRECQTYAPEGAEQHSPETDLQE